MEKENSLVDLMKFFGTPERPVSSKEFKEMWDEMTPEEKDEFKKADLSK